MSACPRMVKKNKKLPFISNIYFKEQIRIFKIKSNSLNFCYCALSNFFSLILSSFSSSSSFFSHSGILIGLITILYFKSNNLEKR